MLASVPTSPKSLDDYEIFVGPEKIENIRNLAANLAGARVLHLNATAFGGGVAELLYALVPLMNDVGMRAEWRVMQGSEEFFTITKVMHNCLQGMDIPVTQDMKRIYEHYNEMNAKMIQEPFDFVIVHDPQPAALPYFLPNRRAMGKHWIWRCHLDLTRLSEQLWTYLLPFINIYDATIFTSQQYVSGHEDRLPACVIIPPTIDPLSPKNMPLDELTVSRTLKKYKLRPEEPLATQVSRYDPWKDPLGVIDSYRIAKEVYPDLQLVLAASMASDDPESWHYYEKTARHAGPDDDIFLLSNLQGVGNLEINAFQRGSDVVLQKSLQEGFGLTVGEAMWKEKPVVGGNVGGITMQIDDGVNGFLVNSVEECADRLLHLLGHPEEARRMGIAAKEKVREKFLSTENLRAYLQLLNDLLMSKVQNEEQPRAAQKNY